MTLWAAVRCDRTRQDGSVAVAPTVRGWLRPHALPSGVPVLGAAQASAAAADAFVAVSLADSLFFSISTEASREQVLVYLLINLVPFAILAPLIGPAIDRFRGSHRLIATALFVSRAALVVGLAITLDALGFYFFALALLILGKASGVTKQALVPALVDTPEQLVAANSHLARMALIAGTAGGGAAAGVLALASPTVTLSIAGVGFVVAAAFATRLPVPADRREPDGVAAETEFLQLHTPVIAATAWAFTLIRATVGFFAFGIAFALRRDSEPAFMYGAAAMAWAVGAFGGNVVAPALRRRWSEDRLTAGSLIALAVVAAFGALGATRSLVIFAALVLGLAASIGRQGFDALVQSRAPHTRRGVAFARFETRFQFGWVGGAVAATAIAAPIRVSMAVVAAGLVPAALFYLQSIAEVHRTDADDPSRPVVIVRRRLERLTSAEHEGQQRFVAVELGGATDLLRAMHEPIGADLVERVEALRRCALAGGEPDRGLLARALRDTLAAVAQLDPGEATARRGGRATSR